MKYSLFLLAILFSAACAAASGDTTRVRTHNKVLIQTDPSKGHTEYPEWGVFPKAGKSWRKMYAELTFQCPPGMTCGEWDYTNSISIVKRRGAHNDTLNWEIMRVITPYGLQFASNWKHTWRFDISDFASLFADSIEIEYHHSGYEARNGRGWLVTLDFTMIEGPEVQPVQNVTMCYHRNVGYGNDSLFDARIPEVSYKTRPGTRHVRYKVIQTGHGSDATGCGEFCAKMRYMVHDGEILDSTLVWRDDCGANPVFPQGGTWVYDRANWCPGADVREVNYDLDVNPGSTHTIDLDMEKYTGGGNYDITLYRIEYGDPVFKTDASIEDIIAPSDELRYSRLNPVCSNPVIIARNCGRDEVKSIWIEYGWEGKKMQRYEWKGTLPFNARKEIELPALLSMADTGNIFIASIVSVNDRPDLYITDNTIRSKPMLRALKVPNKIIIVFKTNNAPTENYYTVKKADGTVVLDRKGFTKPNTYTRDTLSLESGCYLFNFMDDGPPLASYPLNEDGLYWWANTGDGTGFLQMKNGNTGGVIKTFGNDFGTGYWFQMYVDSLPDPQEPQTGLSIHPNPARENLLIDLGADVKNGELTIVLYNLSGQKVLEQNRKGNLESMQFLNLEGIMAGAYMIEVTLHNGNQKLKQKFIKI